MRDLFSSDEELLSFCNFKAFNRLVSSKKSKEDLEKEINDALEKAASIFSQYGSEIDYIKELYSLDETIERVNEQKYSASDINDLTIKKDGLLREYNSFKSTLPLNIKEDLEFIYDTLITNRKKKIGEINNLIASINKNYPNAENADLEELKSKITVFKELKEYLNPQIDEKEENKEVHTEPFVTQISEASDELINGKDIVENNEAFEQVFTDDSFFEPGDTLTESISNNNEFSLFNEAPDEKISSIDELLSDSTLIAENQIGEDDEQTDTSVDNENDQFSFADVPIVELNPNFADETPVEEKDDQVRFEMENGISLVDISNQVYEDDSNWQLLYKANRDIIDKRLEEKGLTHDYEFENDKDILSGLELVVPNNYEKEVQVQDTNERKLVA